MIFVGAALVDDTEPVPFDTCANALGCDDALSEIGVEQKRGKFITAESRGHVSAAETGRYRKTYLLDRLVARQMPEPVIYALKVVAVHHQYAKRRFSAVARPASRRSSEKNERLESGPVKSSCEMRRWI